MNGETDIGELAAPYLDALREWPSVENPRIPTAEGIDKAIVGLRNLLYGYLRNRQLEIESSLREIDAEPDD